ncbi:MAG TPA: UbiA family prenyltransferase, partial [Bacteroidales bacterium]|nr:UbiA family prenyltransferase [Bacteroidales bacterium]
KKARVAYVLLVSIAAFSALLLSIQLKSIYFFLITVVFNGLLWFYAKRYKQQFLVGNLVVAFLSAGLVLYVWLYDLLALIQDPIANSRLEPVMSMMIQVVMTYTGFAFLASLIREIIKDMQDLKGDFETGCHTIPVVIGISATIKLVWGLMALLLALIIWWQFLLFSSTALAAFGFLFVTDSLLLICAMQLSNQSDPQRFKRSSSLMKIVMLTGIFSIVFIHL